MEMGFKKGIDVLETKFKKGQQVEFILYKGNSEVEAKATFEFILKKKLNNKLITCPGYNFDIFIDDATIIETDDEESLKTIYKITVTGFLV